MESYVIEVHFTEKDYLLLPTKNKDRLEQNR